MTAKEFDDLDRYLQSLVIRYDAESEEFIDGSGSVIESMNVLVAAPDLSLNGLESYVEQKQRELRR